jgi:hypothetical protein
MPVAVRGIGGKADWIQGCGWGLGIRGRVQEFAVQVAVWDLFFGVWALGLVLGGFGRGLVSDCFRPEAAPSQSRVNRERARTDGDAQGGRGGVGEHHGRLFGDVEPRERQHRAQGQPLEALVDHEGDHQHEHEAAVGRDDADAHANYDAVEDAPGVSVREGLVWLGSGGFGSGVGRLVRVRRWLVWFGGAAVGRAARRSAGLLGGFLGTARV